MSVSIHPTALVDPAASLGEKVSVGPYTVIEGNVQIGDGCSIGPHVLIASGTRLGKGCRIFKGASLGTVPQDLKFGGEETVLRIGDNTTVREFCTLNRGTKARGETVVGSNCLLMAYCHVAHDCSIGDHFIGANTLNLAGHVTIGHHVATGGTAAIVQFRQVGDYAFIGAYSLIVNDVVPYALVGSDPVRIVGPNKIGLQRNGFDARRRMDIKRAYRILFRQGLPLVKALERLDKELPGNPDIGSIKEFALKSRYGLLRMRAGESG
jgi:UDP-N-acetylglucosamine acyltransferase